MLRTNLARRLPFAAHDLQSHLKTVEYEYSMLSRAAMELRQREVVNNATVWNACIESFAIHSRATIFFLYGHLEEMSSGSETERLGSLRPTDVIAWDFFLDKADWVRHCPAPSATLLYAKRNADKQIAHITADRKELNQPGSATTSFWDIVGVVSELSTGLEEFVTRAPAANIDPAVSDEIRAGIARWKAFLAEDTAVPSPIAAIPTSESVHTPRSPTDIRTVSPRSSFWPHARTTPEKEDERR